MRLQIATGSKRGRARTVTAERLVNMYPERTPDGAEGPVATLGAPGLVLHVDTGGGACRGAVESGGVLYAVCGTGLYSITTAGVSTLLGSVAAGGPVGIAAGGDYVVVVTNPEGYYFQISTATFARITDANYAGAHSVIYINSYFMFANESIHFLGAVGGLLPFDALMAASVEYGTGSIIGLARDHNEALVFTGNALESWQNVQVTDATQYPFDLITGAISEKGLAAPRALCQLDNTTVWLDQTGIVRRLNAGYVPTRISTEAVEYQIAQNDTSDAAMFVYSMEGHEFFALVLPDITLVYDANTQAWHERASYGSSTWIAQFSAQVAGDWYVGSSADGKIYRLSLDADDEDGSPIVASAVFPSIVNERNRFTVNAVELAADVGTGTTTAAPTIRLFVSSNGSTWSSAKERSMGVSSDRDRRLVWRRLGQTDRLILRFDISDAYRRAIYAAYADITPDDR